MITMVPTKYTAQSDCSYFTIAGRKVDILQMDLIPSEINYR